jgi:tetratricopeptide (TPR) repeat protein
MPPSDFRIFLSAVSSEFGRARDAVANDLRARGLTVKVQSVFRQEAGSDTTLGRDHDYIRDCDVVVCIVGRRSGFVPPSAAAAPFAHMLPDGIAVASYTQWEFFAARRYGKRLSIYIAGDAYAPDRALTDGDFDDPGLQQAFCGYIVDELGLNRDYFSSTDELARKILREEWPDRRRGKPISLPYPSLGSLFKGRDAFLRDLHASLTRGPGRTAITGSALHGLGGIGKTRAAVEYAWAHEAEYAALLFVIADTPEALRHNLAALAGPLVLNLPQQHAAEEDVRLAAVLDWLKLNPGWLVILDNLDTEEAVKAADSLLGTLTGGHVLITSRLSAFAGHFDPLHLDVLGIDDAVAFLLERTERRRRNTPDDAATVRLLADDLGGLALALEQAGAYVAKLGMTLARYRELWRENWRKVAGWSDERLMNYPRAFAVTWQTSVDQLTPAGRRLLERLAWFAPEPVPEFLLEVAVPGVEGEDPAEALASLVDYSLARRHPDKPEFTIHRLVQDVTRRGLAGEERQGRLVEALEWVDDAFVGSPQDVQTWPRLDPLAPHVRVIVEHADDAEIIEPTARLMNQLGLLLQDKARYVEAEPMVRRGLAIIEAGSGPDHPEVAIRLNNLADLLRTTNRLAEAEPLFRRALAIDEASYGLDHPAVARDLGNLAVLLEQTKPLSGAEPLLQRALAIDEASKGRNHPLVALRLRNLALLLQNINRLSEAEPLLRRALAIDEASYGLNHPAVARDLNNLAALLRATNELNDAESLYRRALAIDEASYGPNHPHVATILNNLAELLLATNRLGEAEPLFRLALAIDEANYGPNHPVVSRPLNNLAEALRATNRPSEAESLQRRALAIVEASYGPDHPAIVTTLNNLALTLSDTNRLSEAEAIHRRALAIAEASYGPNHPTVATSLHNLAELLRKTDHTSEAEPLFRQALAINQASYGPNHPDVAVNLNNLAELLQTKNRASEAEPLLQRALAIVEASYGPNHPDVAAILNNLAGLMYKANRLREAEPIYRRAMAIVEASYGPNHPDVATKLNNLAKLLQAINRVNDAELLYRRGLVILVRFTLMTGHQHPNLETAGSNYIQALQELGRTEAEIRAALNAINNEAREPPQ